MNKYYNEILQKLEPVEFRQKANFKEENKALKEKHYDIIVVDAIKESAMALGYDFRAKNGIVYIFNGMYWQVVESGNLAPFLRQAAINLGLDKYIAEHHQFVGGLIKQFILSASGLEKETDDTVKINLLNGTFEFGTDIRIREFRKEDFLTYQLPFEYNLDANAPLFVEYLNRVLPDVASQNVLAEYLGYIFTKGSKMEKCLLLYRSGANGKSVFFNIVTALLGKQNISNCTLRELGNMNARALINNKLLNYSSELDAGINNDTFKQLVSGEPLQAKQLYKDIFMMDNYAKLMFNCNDLPKDIEYNTAYFRRWIIIPFTQTIPEQEQDRNLSDKIISDELSGVFNWVLDGLGRLLTQGGFTESTEANNALEEFSRETDSTYQFIQNSGYKIHPENVRPLSAIYREYSRFCPDNGHKALNIGNFRKRLEFHGFSTTRRNYGYGVFLKEEETKEPEWQQVAYDDDKDDELPF